jgi:hypothetical protein
MPTGSPVYANLLLSFLADEYDKLPQYFEWRRNFISGRQETAGDSFVMLYAAELLYLIECSSALTALGRLARLANEQRSLSKTTRNRLAHWIRDFYVLHSNCNPPKKSKRGAVPDYTKSDQFDFPFSWFILENKLMWLYPEYMLGIDLQPKYQMDMTADEIFAMYAGLSSYKIGTSRIIKEGCAKTVRDAFLLAWRAVASRVIDGGQDIETVFADTRIAGSWKIYPGLDIRAGGLYSSVYVANRRFVLNIDAHRPEPFAQFRFRTRYFDQYSTAYVKRAASAFFGDFMKRIDYEIRQSMGFPGSFTAPPDKFAQYFDELRGEGFHHVNRTALRGIDIAAIIQSCVHYTILQLPPNQRTFAKPAKSVKAKASPNVITHTPEVRVTVDFDKLESVRGDADWVFSRLTDGIERETTEPREIMSSVTEDIETPDDGDNDNDIMGFDALMQKLTREQMHVLSHLINASAPETVSALRNAGLTAETFAEGVNELALRAIGDIIIETDGGQISLIEDYTKDVIKAIEGIFNARNNNAG